MTIYYKLDDELGSLTVPHDRMAGEMKRLARCGAVVKGVVTDYDSDAVMDKVCDGLAADIAAREASQRILPDMGAAFGRESRDRFEQE